MKPKKNQKTIKPRVEKKEHDVNPGKDEDIIVKIGRFRLYFQNKYTIFSLANDLFTGGLYFFGTLIQVFTNYERVGMYFYIFGSFFLLMRPILKIAHNVFFYNKKEYEEKVLNKEAQDSEEAGKNQKDESEKEAAKRSAESSNEGKKEIEKGYNEDYYGEGEVRAGKENKENDEEHKKNE